MTKLKSNELDFLFISNLNFAGYTVSENPAQTRVSNGMGQCNFSGRRDSQNSGRDGPGQPKSGTGRGTKRDRAKKDVLKWDNDVLKQKIMF